MWCVDVMSKAMSMVFCPSLRCVYCSFCGNDVNLLGRACGRAVIIRSRFNPDPCRSTHRNFNCEKNLLSCVFALDILKQTLLITPTRQGRDSAGVAKLVDAPDLGSGAARRGGSSPSTRTTH